MAVEHRCGARQPVMLDALLKSSVQGVIPCRVVNLGAGGMYAELDEAFVPPVCAVVQVFLGLPGARIPEALRVSAMVVHRNGRGVGLMFDRSRAREIRGLLQSSSAQSSSTPSSRWDSKPSASLGSNQVDLGGMT